MIRIVSANWLAREGHDLLNQNCLNMNKTIFQVFNCSYYVDRRNLSCVWHYLLNSYIQFYCNLSRVFDKPKMFADEKLDSIFIGQVSIHLIKTKLIALKNKKLPYLNHKIDYAKFVI